MFKIQLINMPFATVHMPSLALMQLKTVLDRSFDGRVATEILYLNHDFARFMGADIYQEIALVQSTMGPRSVSGSFGTWRSRTSRTTWKHISIAIILTRPPRPTLSNA